MPLESATFINDLNTANPVGPSDPKSQGDDHLRLIKNVLKNSFPNMTAVGLFDLVAALNFIIKSTGNGAATGPNLRLQARNAGLTDGQFAGSVIYEFLSDLGNLRIGAQDLVTVNDVSDGTEDTTRTLRTMIGGVLTDRIVISPTGATLDGLPLSGFGSGVRLAFQNTNAPSGWTKDLTHNNKALRLVNGTPITGGSITFSAAFGSHTPTGSNSSVAGGGDVGTHILTTAEMPAHTHTFADTVTSGTVSANHTHTQVGTFSSGGRSAFHQHQYNTGNPGNGSGGGGARTGAAITPDTGNDSPDHSHNTTISGQTGFISANHTHIVSVSGTTSSTGSNTGHDHTFTGIAHTHVFTGNPIDLSVQFVDFIIATKD